MHKFFYTLACLLVVFGLGLTTVASYRLISYQPSLVSYSQPIYLAGTDLDPGLQNRVNGEAVTAEVADARVTLVNQFLERHRSPLLQESGFASKLVMIADRYGLDFRLLPAIAMKESNLCKVTPSESYNCLGLGVHSQGTWRFESYEANFDKAAQVLKKNYIDRGLITPEQIMTRYTPHSPGGEWAKGVNQFMAEMRYNDRQKGREVSQEQMAINPDLTKAPLTVVDELALAKTQ